MSIPASSTASVQKDWQSRELVEIIQLNVLSTANFLNQFDMSMRFKLSSLNEKLNKLERALEYCEAAVRSTASSNNAENDE